MIHLGDVKLTPEEAAKYDEDERERLRSWGVGVPEPPPTPPDPGPPEPKVSLHLPRPSRHQFATFNASFFGHAWVSGDASYTAFANHANSSIASYGAGYTSAYQVKDLSNWRLR